MFFFYFGRVHGEGEYIGDGGGGGEIVEYILYLKNWHMNRVNESYLLLYLLMVGTICTSITATKH